MGQFQPGHPKVGGRKPGVPNRANQQLVAACQQYTLECVARLVTAMRGSNADLAVQAATTLLNRGHGRAPQALHLGDVHGEPFDFAGLSDAGLDRLIANVEQALLRAGVPIDTEDDGPSAPEASGRLN